MGEHNLSDLHIDPLQGQVKAFARNLGGIYPSWYWRHALSLIDSGKVYIPYGISRERWAAMAVNLKRQGALEQ